jgi:putative tryptophan/tyrosine transport system substrate-binding protein
VARAQQATRPVIGFLASGLPEKWGGFVATVLQGLAEAGFVEGRNVTVEYRWAEDQYDRLPALARELVQHPLAVIVAPGTMAAAVAAKAATSTVPIVFMIASDPVEHGLVASLSHPETNLTGVAYLNAEVSTKRLALLHEMVPAATTIAVLVNPANPIEADDQTRELRAAARVLGLNLLVLNARSRMEMEAAFAVLLSERSDALFICRADFTWRKPPRSAGAAPHQIGARSQSQNCEGAERRRSRDAACDRR